MKIGPYPLASPFVLAPMAGVTDAPFRRLCEAVEHADALELLRLPQPGLQRLDLLARADVGGQVDHLLGLSDRVQDGVELVGRLFGPKTRRALRPMVRTGMSRSISCWRTLVRPT